jgi:tape measure domain-containing protein
VAAKKELLLIEIREDGARVVKRNIQDIGDAGDRTMGQMNKLKAVLAGLVSAKVIKDTILLADSYANMLNRLRVVTSGSWELHAAMEAVFKMSRETRTALEGNIDMYSRIAINTKQMGLEMKDVVRFATQLNHAIILSGVTAREAQWGMVQFSQGLAAGALRGDELRAVMEQLPVVTQTLTRYLGIGRGELRKWAFEGRVTTQVIIDAFNDAEKSLAERFGRRIPTVDQAITVLNNSITEFVGSMDQAVQGTGSLATAILFVSDNMDHFGRIIIIVGTALGSVFLVNLYKTLAGMKLFNLSWLTSMKVATLFKVGIVGAAFALAVYSDKIKIANDSTATLADFLKELGANAKTTYKVLRDSVRGVLDIEGIQTEYAVTFETVLLDAAKFVDQFIGYFVGAGQVWKRIFLNIPTYAKVAWNGILSGVEKVKDVIVAIFKTIGNMFKIFGLNMKTAMINLAGAADQMLRGNFKQAKKFGDQAAHSLQMAATQGFSNFGDILNKNLEEAASDDSLKGARFKIKAAGETLRHAYERGFGLSTFVTKGVEDLLARAKAGTTAGPAEKGKKVFSPTPVQSQLLTDMLGDITNVNNQMIQLQELWHAINTKQPGTEGMKATLDQVNRKMNELKLKAMEVNTDVISGFKKGFLQLGLEISNFADLAQKTIVNAFGSMEDAIVSLVTTGKVDFKSMVDSMLADLTRLITRMLFMKALEGLAGGGGMGASFAGLFGVGAKGTAVQGTAPASPKKALGGPVSPGTSYLVGERRPELFTPAQPGHITANPQAAAGAPAQEPVGVTIINVSSEEEALAAMNSAEGKRIIMNVMRTERQGAGI